ncbi:MAG: C40 family peptidase [Coriobacteriia bacterium]
MAGVDSASVAQAAPRAEILARAADVKKQVDDLDQQTEILSEDFNAASVRHSQLAKQERAAAKRLKATTKRTGSIQERLGSRAASMYRNGRMGFMEVLLGASDFEEFAKTWDFLRELNEDDARTVEELKIAKAEQAEAQRLLAQRTQQAAAESEKLAARRKSIEAKLSDRKRMLSGLEAEVAALDRAEERRRAAEAARASRAPSDSGGRTFPPPTKAARSEVVAIAKRYLGARYVWGAEGPNTFDCSGFTMYVYRQVGVRLPRVSRDQIHAGQRVSRGDLQPGDLVFFGSPIHHVGIYVGGGMMIHSPRTGDVVKISPLHSDYVGASRP